MEDFAYKEYTEGETKIYNEAMCKIMEALEKGLTFEEACGAAKVEDEQLRGFILDDALKVAIADMFYRKGFPLPEVAAALQVSIDRINKANAEMLEDVEISATEMYRMNNPNGPVGNA